MIKVMQRETYVSDLADEYRRGYDEGRRSENEKLTQGRMKRTEYKGGNGMTKVKLPREVAEAVEGLRKITCSNYEVMCVVRSAHANPNAIKVRDWFADGAGTHDLLMEALVNGYEIEKTPEEIVRQKYEMLDINRRLAKLSYDDVTASKSAAKREGMREVLDAYGIKVEGVNA